MPFTPFHLGPGLLLKGAAPSRVSLTSFAVTQFLIDLESRYNLMRHEWPVHRMLHTAPASMAAGAAVAAALYLAGRAAGGPASAPSRGAAAAEWALLPLMLGGLAGGLTHPILDAFINADVRPFLPFIGGNPLYHSLWSWAIHLACAASGAGGIALLLMRWLRRHRAASVGA